MEREIYEALQAVNACLNETGEALLVDAVEKIRTSLRHEARYAKAAGAGSSTEAVLKSWVDFGSGYAPED